LDELEFVSALRLRLDDLRERMFSRKTTVGREIADRMIMWEGWLRERIIAGMGKDCREQKKAQRSWAFE